MTQEERIAQLEQDNAELRAQLAEAYQQITQLAERLHQVEGQLATGFAAQAERDLRMAPRPAKNRGNLSRVATQLRRIVACAAICPPCDSLGHAMLAALVAVFVDKPLPVAWGS